MKKSPAKIFEEIYKNKTGFDYFRNKLKLKDIEAKNLFSKKYPHIDKFMKKKGVSFEKLREHSAKILGAGALTGTLLLSPPSGINSLPTPLEVFAKLKSPGKSLSDLPQKTLIDLLAQFLPERPRPLSRNEERVLEQMFEEILGIKTRATLEGEHLNTSFGLIGAEQHLKRYPGDNLSEHGEGTVLKEGIAPGLGAWGYFAPSKDKLTPSLKGIEKWYAVVQTLYLPDWNSRQPYLRNWYKYRKVLIVNTNNGNAVVASVADSGPAMWTGKNFGGSPEVMQYLGGPRYKKGAVLVFFVDDPENKVPLGPVDYNKVNVPLISLEKG
ncbi:hypothetical protein KJ570_00180 [Patescibacteria group bacterium]|nr:hypothetical protein [Patescibacteria group bacterium]MBU2036007.1 hypothetical protein [Patescibacteria group bacterium]